MHEHYEPAEVYALLHQHHAPKLPDEEQFILAARAVGMSFAEMGVRLATEERKPRRIIKELGKSVAIACGISGTDDFVTGFWLAVHATCEHRCTARAMAMLTGEDPVLGAGT